MQQAGAKRWIVWVDRGLAVGISGLMVAYVLVALLGGGRAFDYGKMMYAADLFCFDNAAFDYSLNLETWYPAPYYTTFCLPYHFLEPLFYVAWMLAPLVIALWLARGSGLALTFAPLGDLLLLGQNSWMWIPLFALGKRHRAAESVPWWQGLVMAFGVLKPHLVLPVWLWVGWHWLRRWREAWRALLAWGLGLIALLLPAFLLRPGWVGEWLGNAAVGRGLEASMGKASIALIPNRLGWSTAGMLLTCVLTALIFYAALRWRRGRLDFYDWTLIYLFAAPVINDYDLIVLLPFLVAGRRRMAVALAAGIATWGFVLFSGRWSLSIFITLALIVERLWNREAAATQ